MDLSAHPALAFRFDRLTDTFTRFSQAFDEGDEDRSFLRYLRFKSLAELIIEDAEAADGHPTHFKEESHRVLGWMEYAVRLNDAPGYCPDQPAAQLTLNGALTWDFDATP